MEVTFVFSGCYNSSQSSPFHRRFNSEKDKVNSYRIRDIERWTPHDPR